MENETAIYCWRRLREMEIKDSVLDVVCLIPIRHSNRDVKYALGHKSLECRGEVQAEDENFEVMCL